jgi:hypothetical protein
VDGEEGRVPKIAVIQDGTELARQTDADISGLFEAICGELSRDGLAFESQLFTDEAVVGLLDGLTPRDFPCLVIASNALNSGQIEAIMRRSRASLDRYFEQGGGLVVLHQFCDSLASVLPEGIDVPLRNRASPRMDRPARCPDPDDILLHQPFPVDERPLVDGGLPGPPSLFYRAIPAEELPAPLKPVLTHADELLLVRTHDHVEQRVVVATLPPDWQRATDLLGNAIRFACLGRPRRLVWEEQGASRSQLLLKWLTWDGGTMVRPVPTADGPLETTQQWLLRHVDMLVLPRQRLQTAQQREEVQAFLASGGTVLSFGDHTNTQGSDVTALVGAHTERRLSRRLHGELRAVSGWDAADYAFELRNTVAAVAFLAARPENHTAGAVTIPDLQRLSPDLCSRLRDARHREDLSSSIAHMQTLALLSGERPLSPDLVDWAAADPRRSRFDVDLQLAAATLLAAHRADPAFPSMVAARLRERPGALPLPPLIRVLDSIAILDQVGLFEGTTDAVRDIAVRVCTELEASEFDGKVGWLSVEATADTTRGLVTLLRHVALDETSVATRLSDLVAAAATVLQPALDRYERSTKGVAWLARVVHALVAVDRHFPIGLQRLASLDWPAPPGQAQHTATEEHALLEHLSEVNMQLRAESRELADARLAIRTGRAAATIGVTALATLPLVYLLVALRPDSTWTLIGNITVLVTLLLAVTTGLFGALERRHLLAAPARRLHQWVTDTTQLISPLSKLKSK